MQPGESAGFDRERERRAVDQEADDVDRGVASERREQGATRAVVGDRPVERERPRRPRGERERAGEQVRDRREDEDDGVDEGAGRADWPSPAKLASTPVKSP